MADRYQNIETVKVDIDTEKVDSSDRIPYDQGFNQ